MTVLPPASARRPAHSFTATVSLVALLLVISSSPVAAAWPESIDRLALEAVRGDLQLAAARSNQEFWRNWLKTDRAVVGLFHRDPAFADAVRFQDPHQQLNAYPMLLQALATNACWLHALGRHRDALRVRKAAARLANFAAQDDTLWSTLILNTLSRFLLAGWRDVDDPVATLEFQVHQALSNAEQLRARVQGPIPPRRVSRWQPLLLAACRPLAPWWPQRLALLLLPVSGDFMLPPLLVAGPPPPSQARAGAHNPLLDDLAYALNLPFSLAPAALPVTRHLEHLPPDLPRGAALLLGGGDGAEALAVAVTGRFLKVTVVEHSPLAVRRTTAMAARLRPWLADRRKPVEIEAVADNVIHYHPAPDSCALVLAIHLLEYLPGPQRQQLYDALQPALLPGSQVVIAVHLARGPRYEGLISQYANVRQEASEDGVRITLSQLVPAHPEAVQVQTFFHEDAFSDELKQAFPPSLFLASAAVEKTAAGFAELTVTLTRRPDGP